MIVVDTSAVVAILSQEPEAERIAEILAAAPERVMSAVSHLETAMVLTSRYGPPALDLLDEFTSRAGLAVVPFDRDQADQARAAFLKFGKGRHPAGLNFGDCAAYALSARRGWPLLFKGDDFAKTDLPAAMRV